MKTAAKVFIWIGMIGGAICVFPLVIGILALKKIEEAKSLSELQGWGIAVLLCCSTLGGIFMLNIRQEDLTDNDTISAQQAPTQSSQELNNNSHHIEQELMKAQELHNAGILTDDEYQEIRKSIIDKLLK